MNGQTAQLVDLRLEPEQLLCVENLSFGHSKKKTLVNGLTFAASPGEIVVVTGPSGAGKTTLLRLLAGDGHLTNGSAKWAGQGLSNRTKASPRIALLEQSFPLFDELNVQDNIVIGTLGPFGRANEKEALRAEGLLHDLGMGPEFLTRSPATLSGGEKQRVGIARTLASDCPFVLLDEPLSNLDGRSKVRAIRAILRHVREGSRVAIIVVHDDFDALQLADQIILFSESNAPATIDLRSDFDLGAFAKSTGFGVPAGVQTITYPDGNYTELLATEPTLMPTKDQLPAGSNQLLFRTRRVARTPLGLFVSLINVMNGEPLWVFRPDSDANALKLVPGNRFYVMPKSLNTPGNKDPQ